METGQRKDGQGKTIPREIINTFSARFTGKEVFSAELFPGISANPYMSFHFRVPGPGDLELSSARGRRRQSHREAEAERRRLTATARPRHAEQAFGPCRPAHLATPAGMQGLHRGGRGHVRRRARLRAEEPLSGARSRPAGPISGVPAGARPSSPSATARTRPRPSQPLRFVAKSSGTFNLCGCKGTDDKPFCDGTHNVL